MRRAITAGLMTMLPFSACGDRAMEPADVFGSWRVASHTAGFVAALSDAEAAAWIGREASYGPARAVFHDEACEEPSYTPGSWTPGAFSAHFQIRPSALGIESETISTLEVGCPGPWTAPGSTLILAGDRTYTPWEGVFFELQRAR